MKKIIKVSPNTYSINKDYIKAEVSEIAKKSIVPSCFGTMTAVVDVDCNRTYRAADDKEAEDIGDELLKEIIGEYSEQIDKLEQCLTMCKHFDHCYAVSLVDANRRKA